MLKRRERIHGNSLSFSRDDGREEAGKFTLRQEAPRVPNKGMSRGTIGNLRETRGRRPGKN